MHNTHGLAKLTVQDYILLNSEDPKYQLIFRAVNNQVLSLIVDPSRKSKSSMLSNFLNAIDANEIDDHIIGSELLAEILLIDDILDKEVPKILAFFELKTEVEE